MSRLTYYALGAVLALSPALIYAQNAAGTDQSGATGNSNYQTGQSGAATTPGVNNNMGQTGATGTSNNNGTSNNAAPATSNSATGTANQSNSGTATTPQAGTMNNNAAAPNTSSGAPATPAPGTTGQYGTSNRAMPHTASNWLGMLLAGGLLSGAGLGLRRRLANRA